MKHKRLAIILLVFVAVTNAVATGVAWRLGFINSVLVNITAPACSDPVLTTAPTGDENIASITPLGNISLPNHSLPTDHTYHVLKRGPDGLPLNTEVFSPANLTVGRITFISTTRDGQTLESDHKIDMVVCKKVTIQFDHIRELSPKLAAAYNTSKPKCQQSQRDQDLNKYCSVNTNIKLSAGELVGVAGGDKPVALDFGATDGRQKPLEFANNKRYRGESRRTICPYDLFGSDLKKHFYQFLGENEQRRVGEPICGTIAQDVPGSAQGNWFDGKGQADKMEREGKTVSLIHDNVDPKLGVIVLGIKTKLAFSPTYSGLVNREFSEVKPGQEIYCYHPDATGSRATYGTHEQFKGSVLVRLVSAAELDIEIRSKDCGSAVFGQPTRLIR